MSSNIWYGRLGGPKAGRFIWPLLPVSLRFRIGKALPAIMGHHIDKRRAARRGRPIPRDRRSITVNDHLARFAKMCRASA